MLARLVGATIGATVLRWAVWRGGSMRMKLGSSSPLGWSAIWIPPSSWDDEKVAGSSSTRIMSA